MQNRVYNFSAGPAILPLEVLKQAQVDLLDYGGSGIGVMELSHRGTHFEEIIASTEGTLRELLGLSDDFAVLFTTGGASQQFSMIPMNLLSAGTEANYIVSGHWGKEAAREAQKFGAVHIAASSEDRDFTYFPKRISLSPNPAYLHFTSNNTIYGTQTRGEPNAGKVPLICDASSDFLSHPIATEKYALIYAGAQKNVGPAGVTLVLIRRELLARSPEKLPLMLDYRTYSDHRSLYNTPPTFPIYVVGRVLQWIKDLGGLHAIEKRNNEKAQLLYDCIDKSGFYRGTVEKEDRSLMNVTFRLPSEDLEKQFIKQAEQEGLSGLKGHRKVGGCRASIYNAFPLEGVQSLVKFMQAFVKTNG